jgi:hypothetical protein
MEDKGMCYEIRELIGKKTRESNSIQRTGWPETSERVKMEDMMRAWLKKRVLPKGRARDKKERPVEGGISGIAGGGGKEVFPTAPWAAGGYVIVEPFHLIPDFKRRTILRSISPFVRRPYR